MLLVTVLVSAVHAACTGPEWVCALEGYGTDKYVYPQWAMELKNSCTCKGFGVDASCKSDHSPPPGQLGYCEAKLWLLKHMPVRDVYALPPAVSILGDNMLDDTILFAMFADRSAKWAAQVSSDVKMAYLLPHSHFMEATVNWRPGFFAKFFPLVAQANSTLDALSHLISPNTFLNWSPDGPPLRWNSSTSPPSIGAYDFIANEYASCTGFSTYLVQVLRSVGVPARVVGAPCWNTGNYKGLVSENVNVSRCWAGGDLSKGDVGGEYLWNHNWVEVWDSVDKDWVFVNVPPTTAEPNQGWQCGGFTRDGGCSSGPASYASLDHPIVAYTWTLPEELPEDGGQVLLGSTFTLSNGVPATPTVWSPSLKDATGVPQSRYLRFVNRTDFYRNRNDP